MILPIQGIPAMPASPAPDPTTVSEVHQALCEIGTPKSPAMLRDGILAVLRGAVRNEVPGGVHRLEPDEARALSDPELASMTGAYFVAWCDDHNGIALYAVPEDRMTPEWRHLCSQAHGAVF